MKPVIGAVAGAIVAFFVIWILALDHRYNLVADDYRAALGALITGGLSFLGGWFEHRRGERNGKRKELIKNDGNGEA